MGSRLQLVPRKQLPGLQENRYCDHGLSLTLRGFSQATRVSRLTHHEIVLLSRPPVQPVTP